METRTQLTHEGDVWVLRVARGGRAQEYRCATEAQALQLQAMLSPPPEPSQPRVQA